jgi:hypothetical protein
VRFAAWLYDKMKAPSEQQQVKWLNTYMTRYIPARSVGTGAAWMH